MRARAASGWLQLRPHPTVACLFPPQRSGQCYFVRVAVICPPALHAQALIRLLAATERVTVTVPVTRDGLQ